MIIQTISNHAASVATTAPQSDRLEAAFLSEMLKYTGIESSQSPFSGGAGESQFASWLTEQRAEALARRLDLKFPEIAGIR